MTILHAGLAQVRAPAASSAGDLGIESGARSIPRLPAAISPMLQAFTAGLQRDPVSRAAGWEDGKSGASFQPRHFDAFSYACGFASGRQFAPRRGTCVANPSK